MNSSIYHVPVLLESVLELLSPQDGGDYIDATVGSGGHAEGLLGKNKFIRVLGIDRDLEVVEVAKNRLAHFGSKVEILHGNYSKMDTLVNVWEDKHILGVLLDLGISSFQLDDPSRGFSFQIDGPLNMRMDPQSPFSAIDLLNQSTERDLCHIFRKYGEEPKAKAIAKAIINENRHNPLLRTVQLADLIKKVAGFTRKGYSKSVARCFQAIRIAINDELVHLDKGITKAIDLLKPGGRLVIISFHSLEDRIVKKRFRHEALECTCPPGLPICRCHKKARVRRLTDKPIQAAEEEIRRNPRAHSAKLRAVVKL